ncbi:C40 family peptidase [Streptomyces varsoviensis]|nr:VCBS repeat-containing protein [Streptomyces varsoviensis]
MPIVGIARRSTLAVLTATAAVLATTAATAPAVNAAPVPASVSPQPRGDYGSAGQGAVAPMPQGAAAKARLAAPAMKRSEALARAQSWVGKGLPYNMDGSYQGYRTDCSGFVSMAWGIAKPGQATNTFVPNGVAHWITKAELKPGDALNNPNPGKYGHITLFEKWADSSQSSYWGYEFSWSGVHHRVIPYPYFNGSNPEAFKPLRFNGIEDDALVGMTNLTSADFDGDGKTDVVAVEQESGKLFFYAGDGKGSIGGGSTRKEIGTNWDSMQDLVAGDFDGDGKADLLAVERSTGKLFLYPGDGKGGVGGASTRKEIGTNWDSMHDLVAGDFNGDGKTDVVAVEQETGKLFLYPGDGKGGIGGGGNRKEIGTNWNTMQSLAAGDFNGDKKTDLFAVEKGTGKLFLYPGDGKGGIGGGSTRKEVGTNWDSMRGLTAGDFDGDGKTDLLAIENDTQKLFFYGGDGKGGIGGGSTRKEIGTNW